MVVVKIPLQRLSGCSAFFFSSSRGEEMECLSLLSSHGTEQLWITCVMFPEV